MRGWQRCLGFLCFLPASLSPTLQATFHVMVRITRIKETKTAWRGHSQGSKWVVLVHKTRAGCPDGQTIDAMSESMRFVLEYREGNSDHNENNESVAL